jgi:urea transport system substrate-binding protein
MLVNHHITKPVYIGEIKATASSTWCEDGRPGGRRRVVEGAGRLQDLVGDWVKLNCGNFNTKTNKCGS